MRRVLRLPDVAKITEVKLVNRYQLLVFKVYVERTSRKELFMTSSVSVSLLAKRKLSNKNRLRRNCEKSQRLLVST